MLPHLRAIVRASVRCYRIYVRWYAHLRAMVPHLRAMAPHLRAMVPYLRAMAAHFRAMVPHLRAMVRASPCDGIVSPFDGTRIHARLVPCDRCSCLSLAAHHSPHPFPLSPRPLRESTCRHGVAAGASGAVDTAGGAITAESAPSFPQPSAGDEQGRRRELVSSRN
ncbi:unnamed protein product [Closterium sp. NIES-54]